MDLGDPDLWNTGDEMGVILPSEADSIVDYGEGTRVGIGRQREMELRLHACLLRLNFRHDACR